MNFFGLKFRIRNINKNRQKMLHKCDKNNSIKKILRTIKPREKRVFFSHSLLLN